MRNLKIFESPQRAKRKLAALGVTCLAVAGVGAALLGSASAAGPTLWVNDDDPNGGGYAPPGTSCSDPGYSTIGAAVTAAGTGDTIEVCAGTYPENVVLNKDLTLNGEQAGVDARGRVASESTITASGNVVELQTGSAGTTLDGFTVMGGARGVTSSSGPITGLELLNNRVVGFTGNGVFLNDTGLNITAHQNVVDGTSKVGGGALFHLDTDNFDGFRMTDSNIVNGATATGFFVDGNRNVGLGPRVPMLSGNLFDGNVTGVNLGSRAVEDAEITGNTVSDNSLPGMQGGMLRTLIEGNTFSDNGRGGLELTSFGSADPLRGAQHSVITENDFTGNGFNPANAPGIGEGIFFSATQAPTTISTNVAHLNNITGNEQGARYLGSETINMECNWWGHVTGPMHIMRPTVGMDTVLPGGMGDSVVDDGDGIDYTPWLTAAAPGGPCDGPLPEQMERKQDVRDSLAAKLPTGNKHDDHEIEKAIEHIDKSLDDDLWVDENHLDPKHGNKVFDEERSAVKHLEHVDTVDVTAEMDEIVDIDHDLAQTAISEIPPASNPSRQDKVDKETAKANEELAKGDADATAGDRDKAIEHYKKAWEHAQNATKEANKP